MPMNNHNDDDDNVARIDFVLGGKVLNRQMPEIFQADSANLSALLRGNHRAMKMSLEEWNLFCDDIEAAMSFSKHWHKILLSKSVLISSWLFGMSVILLLCSPDLMIQTPEAQAVIHRRNNSTRIPKNHTTTTTMVSETTTTIHNSNNHSHHSHHSHHNSNHSSSQNYQSYQTLHYHGHQRPLWNIFLQDILPDFVVLFLLIAGMILAISFIQLSYQFQQNIVQVCYHYTQRYEPYHGIRFVLRQRPIGSSPMVVRPASITNGGATAAVHHGILVAASTGNNKKFQPYIEISIRPEEATLSYQGSGNSPSSSQNNMHPHHYQHPNSTMSGAPFFDLPADTFLIPPANNNANTANNANQQQQQHHPHRFAGVHVPTTWKEQSSKEGETTSP